MLRHIPSRFQTVAAGITIGLISLLIPLLRDFHWESAGLAAFVSAIYAAFLSAHGKEKTFEILRKVTGLLVGWAFPLILFAIFTNCMSFDGTAYWLFGPFPSMFLGWSIGHLVHHFKLKKKKSVILTVILGLAIVPTLYEFLSFPQLYFFNHIWSYWPGPIYDEIAPFDSRLLLFRSITVFWVITLWSIPHFFEQKMYRLIAILSMLCIMFSYFYASDWGLIAPEERLQAELGALYETEHFIIFYSKGSVEPGTVDEWGFWHEEYLRNITNTLELDRSHYRSDKIHSYIYHDPLQKKRLTGAGQTSYVPVWLSRDQTHIASEHLERVLNHELVHIVAKQFGNRFGASTSIGLVEGLAVALDPDRYRSTIDRLVAARDERPDVVEIRRIFSPAGFYTTAGPVSYVVSGSFVKYLIENYPVEQFKQAYRTGDIEQAYAPLTLEDLTDSWHIYLDGIELEEEDLLRSAALFRTPSIFDKPCPRVDSQRQIRDQFTIYVESGPGSLYGIPCGG